MCEHIQCCSLDAIVEVHVDFVRETNETITGLTEAMNHVISCALSKDSYEMKGVFAKEKAQRKISSKSGKANSKHVRKG